MYAFKLTKYHSVAVFHWIIQETEWWFLISPVNGAWSQWTSYGSCSLTCGGDGNQVRTRECNNPSPLGGGADCSGKAEESKPCHVDPCPGNLERAVFSEPIIKQYYLSIFLFVHSREFITIFSTNLQWTGHGHNGIPMGLVRQPVGEAHNLGHAHATVPLPLQEELTVLA